MKIKTFLTIMAILLFSTAMSSVSFASPVLWISDSSGNLGTVDVATGAVNSVVTIKDSSNNVITMTDIAFNSSGQLYGISLGNTTNSGLYTINTTTGLATEIGSGTGQFLNSLVFDSKGDLYAANTSLYKIDTGTGVATSIGTGGGYDSSGDLAFVGGKLYLSSKGSPDDLFTLDPSTGFGTLVGSTGVSAVFGLATNNNITLYGAAGENVYHVDTLTGAATYESSWGSNVLGLGPAWGTAFKKEANPVPEPMTMVLFGMSLIGLGGVKFMRKKE